MILNTCFDTQIYRMHIQIKIGTLLEPKTAVDVNMMSTHYILQSKQTSLQMFKIISDLLWSNLVTLVTSSICV